MCKGDVAVTRVVSDPTLNACVTDSGRTLRSLTGGLLFVTCGSPKPRTTTRPVISHLVSIIRQQMMKASYMYINHKRGSVRNLPPVASKAVTNGPALPIGYPCRCIRPGPVAYLSATFGPESRCFKPA
jgi:hypothetical protein